MTQHGSRAARALVLAAMLVPGDAALAQTPPRPAAPAAKPAAPDPAYEASRAAFEALPEAVRKAVQDALVWTGDYNAVTAGTFGRRTYEGIVAWQKRSGADGNGLLTPPQRAALDLAGEAARNAARFKVQADPASGAVIGVPERPLAKRSPLPGGTRWQSADGRITLDTKSFRPGETDLDTLFERATAETADRRVTYKVKKPDFIVVTGETGSGRSYLRYATGEAGIRGFTIGYDKVLAAQADRLVIAVANSFVPFPEAPPAPPPGAAAPGSAPNPAVVSQPKPAARPAATGLVLAPGRVLTSAAALEGCALPAIAGQPARPAKRDASGVLLLLETEPRPALASSGAVPIPRSEAVRAEEPLVVLGAEPKGLAAVAPGVAEAGDVLAPLQPGAGGAPILDRSGRLVGLVANFPAATRLIAGVAPPTRYAVLPGAAVAAFLAQAGIAPADVKPAPPSTLGAAAAPFVRSVVAIDCTRS